MFSISGERTRARRIAAVMVFTATIYISLMPKAAADESDKKTVVTTTTPIELPGGKTLPAGTYVFKLMDSPSNRSIVQVFDKNEQHLYATLLAVPDYRLKPADKPVIEFEERPSGQPMALKAIFYPGDNYGEAFVYPHDQAVQLAKQNRQNVLSMPNAMSRNISAPAKDSKAQSVQQLENTQVSGVNSEGEPVALEVVILSAPEGR